MKRLFFVSAILCSINLAIAEPSTNQVKDRVSHLESPTPLENTTKAQENRPLTEQSQELAPETEEIAKLTEQLKKEIAGLQSAKAKELADLASAKEDLAKGRAKLKAKWEEIERQMREFDKKITEKTKDIILKRKQTEEALKNEIGEKSVSGEETPDLKKLFEEKAGLFKEKLLIIEDFNKKKEETKPPSYFWHKK